MEDWPVLTRYDSDHLREIALPLGGIGTGCFALGGRGSLTDWQLMNRPHRGWKPLYSHLLLRTQQSSAREPTVKLRVLEGDLTDGLAADSGAPAMLAGVPRFEKVTFEAAYPFGRVRLSDRHTPVAVALEGFNPLIPRDTDASSLPMALLTLSLTNRTAAPLDAALTLLLSNFIGTDGLVSDLKDNVTERAEFGDWKGLRFAKTRPARTPQNGTLAVLCDAPDVRVAPPLAVPGASLERRTAGPDRLAARHGLSARCRPGRALPAQPGEHLAQLALRAPDAAAAGDARRPPALHLALPDPQSARRGLDRPRRG